MRFGELVSFDLEDHESGLIDDHARLCAHVSKVCMLEKIIIIIIIIIIVADP